MLSKAKRHISDNPVVPYDCRYCKKYLTGRDVIVIYDIPDNEERKLGPYWVFCDEVCAFNWQNEYANKFDDIGKESLKLMTHIHVEEISK